MAVLFFNKDGKIHEFWDYFDVTGFSQQHLNK
jgi:limonene-1,2-epoxide hydrolase